MDVVIHDRQPAEARSLGLDPDSLVAANPDLIVSVITPFGSSGPYSGYRARGINVFHAGGEGYLLPNGLALDTFPDRAPLTAGSHMGSYQGGLTAALGVLAAVYARRSGASGQAVDCSMQEAQLAIGYLPVQRLEAEGIVEDRFSRFFRVGGVLPAQDGYVELLTLEPRQWEALAELLGHPDWAASERFQDPVKYGPDINKHLREWASQHTKDWLYEHGQAQGVPIAPYLTPEEVFHSRQQRERGYFVSVDHPEAGCFQYAGLPYRFSETPERLGRAPLLGEHNSEVFRELGYSPQDLVDLARAGAI
jgi:crotonobetainyl-CoA:carnitine CoA-transferase CaiB-like acyl-CoA transferase